MTLYLKYRPQTIDELDLESVRTQLKEIVASGNMPHAFLFSGPKGTGKTSAARILAKIINCEHLTKEGEPCNKCASCISITNGNNIDIIELDAASNRGIDDIRSLKEGVSLSPNSAKKKVYIIDEAHMLTLEAANAFLKTLEEPPDHVVFILATTNPEKLPETVISRLTRVNFTKASAKDIARQLNRVAEGEKIKIEDIAIEKIAKIADGSFRDAVKILESLIAKNKGLPAGRQDIKKEDIIENSNSVTLFFELLSTNKPRSILEFIENLVTNGISIKNFTQDLLATIHRSILAKNAIGEDELVNFTLEDLLKLNQLIAETKSENSSISQLPLEIAIIKFCNLTPKESPLKVKLDDSLWQKLLALVHEKNATIEGLLRATKPLAYDGKLLEIGVYYQFHKERLEDAKNGKILEEACKAVFNIDSIKIKFNLIDRPAYAKASAGTVNHDLNIKVEKDIIDAAKEIFG